MLAILAAVMLAAAPQHDTVFTADGGRVVGTVVEEGAQGVTVQLVDGTFRRLARREVVRIEYADGTVSTPSAQQPPGPSAPPSAQPPPPRYAPPPPPRYAPPPPPRYAPPPPGPYPARPPPPPARWSGAPISPFYLSFGLGGLFLSGEAEDDVDMRDLFHNQVNLALEGGLRLNPHIALAIYGDFGFGDPASGADAACGGFSCSASTGRVGLLLRHTFEPAARTTPWIAVGTGYEYGTVSFDDDFDDEVFTYRGWEVLRLLGGVDLRSNPAFGVGLYGGVAFGRYSRFEDAGGTDDTVGNPFHTTVEAGLRFTLFP